MPQKTNLNISPYYDDFDKAKNFYKVLFKPGYPVQARELTNLQSILQNQLESFGSHIFKEGSMVIPGGVTVDDRFYSVKVNPTHLGIDITVYLDALVNNKVRIKGQNSQIVASIKKYILPPEEEVEDITIFVKYLESGTDLQSNPFPDGEILLLEENVTYGNTTLTSGSSILTLKSSDATAVGSAVGISQGVYFIRGTFVDVPTTQIVLDPYNNKPSYRVGLTISEEIITSNDDKTLNDNAKGFTNYAAPGADRFKISVDLSKKSLTDNEDTNFVELVKINQGEIKKLQNTSVYSEIKKYFAKRTYEESGDYAVTPFTVNVLNSLNDEISSAGVYKEGEKTEQGNTPSEDKMCVKVSPGKAYVRGFDIDLNGSTVLDVDKPRDTKTIDSALISFNMGSLLKVNNVYGVPYINVGNSVGGGSNIIELYNRRRNTSTTNAGTGYKIGEARIYWYGVSDAPYSGATTEWDLYLFDIQTYTSLTLSRNIGNVATSFIRGLSSGATGYLANKPSSTVFNLTQTSGSFIQGEQVIINEDTSSSAAIVSLVEYGTEDIKSVYQDSNTLNSALLSDFIADAVLYEKPLVNFSTLDTLTINTSGIATCPGRFFSGSTGIKTDSIIKYTKAGATLPTFNRVDSISTNGSIITLSALDTTAAITGIAEGSLPAGITTSTFSVVAPRVTKLSDSSLFSVLPKKNIASVNLSSSNLVITKQITGKTTSATGTLTIASSDLLDVSLGVTTAFYEPFDAEKYSIHYSNGTTESLTSDQFSLASGGTSVTFTGLTPSSNVTVVATARKLNITSKPKEYVRSKKLVVSSTSGITTSTSGLTTSLYYGMRIEDREISLNVPDVSKVIAIYESTNSSAPVLDKLTFVSGLSLNTNTILGEKVVGEKSRAIGQLVTRSSSTEVEIVYLNQNRFEVGETVTFKESNIVSNLQALTKGSYINRTNNYTLDKGHKIQYSDYSRIVRREGGPIPAKQLMVIFDHYRVSVGSTTGDVFSVNSYTQDRYTNDIPTVGNNIRTTDIIDFRPRVSEFTSTTSSPFAFSSRTFESRYPYVITPDESSLVGYSYYLPRVDKVTLNRLGQVSVIKGVSSDNPKPPVDVDDSMEIAQISLPAYLYDPINEPQIKLFDNRRFTMRDIANLENRIKNLEQTTTLTALELDTKSLQITDAQGLNRFKSGFVVDNFQNRDFIDLKNKDTKCDVDTINKELITAVDFWSMSAELALDPGIDPATADLTSNLKLLDPNIQKTGDLLTLKYTPVGWIEQPHATQVENVNPFNVIVFVGGVVLDPASDNWVRTIYIDKGRTESTGAAWAEKSNTTIDVESREDRTAKKLYTTEVKRTTFSNELEGPSREFDYVESVKISGDVDPYMRSRNVYFAANGLKPFTTHYHYLDAQQPDICPKLVEIEMISGTFKVFENVQVYYDSRPIAFIKLHGANVKFGDTTRPDIGAGLGSPSVLVETYTVDPYDRTRTPPGEYYSATSKLLNFDVRRLAGESDKYYGYVIPGAIVVGETTGAVARVTRSELISDNWGDIIGSFFFREPTDLPTPTVLVRSGTKTFKVTATPPGVTPLPGSTSFASQAQGTYSGSGTILTQNTTTVSVRNPPRPATKATEIDVKTVATHRDPLAQSFTVDGTGAFLTSFDVYFAQKDPSAKIFIELRTVELGTPTNFLVQDYTQVALNPSDIFVSNDASAPTNIKFPSPVYLEADKEYALVFLSPASDLYEMWVATMGQKTVRTKSLPDVENVIVSKQYIGGSLFKSQNGTIWTASQYQDLTFKLYKAEFVSNGKLTFYNSSIEPGNINAGKLPSNPIKTLPRKLKVAITGSAGVVAGLGASLVPGRQVGEGSATGTSITGIIEKVGGPISGTASAGITTVGVGTGYPDGTYTNVPLYSISGSGADATATVIISGGTVSNVNITALGTGYVIGETLGITTSSLASGSSSGRGTGAKIGVTAIGTPTHLYLSNVQGEQFNSGQNLIIYVSGSRYVTSATINGSSSLIDQKYTGNIFEISQYNHAHHGANNKIQIKNVQPDTEFIKTTSDLGISSTTVSVANTTPFATFEGISTSSGYALIESEIISYTSIGTGTLTIGTRGIDGTSIFPHASGSFIQPYQCSGVSLTRINTTFDIPSSETIRNLNGIDNYYLEFDRTGRSSGGDQISFIDEKSIGGDTVKISQNHQFSSFNPQFNVITPGKGTTINAQVRTVSGTSAGGSEVSFIDQGYEPISLNNTSFFPTPRMVASKVNETARLSAESFPRNKSLSLVVDFTSEDKNLSPVMDIQNATFVMGRNKINSPVSDYASDDRTNKLSGDPHGSVFISKKIDLKQQATSLQVFVGANRPPESDFRVFYKLFKADSSGIEQSYLPFPGYDNLKDTDGDGYGDLVIDPSNNNGRPDAFVSPNIDGQFFEYQFTANNLDPFNGFIIKVVMSSTNESAPIKLKDFRAIALA